MARTLVWILLVGVVATLGVVVTHWTGGVGLAGADEPSPTGMPPGAPAADEKAWRERVPYASILLVGAQKGKLKPCGCSKPQLGGVERLAALVERLRARAPDGRYTGISLGWSMAGRGEPQEESKAGLYRAVLGELGFSALLLGVPDLYVHAMAQPFESASEDAALPGTDPGLEVPRPPLNVLLRESHPAFPTQPEAVAEITLGDLLVRTFTLVDPETAERLKGDGVAEAALGAASAVQSLQPNAQALWIVGAWLSGTQMEELKAGMKRLGPSVIVDLSRAGGSERLPDTRLTSEPLVVTFDDLGKAVGVLDVEAVPAEQGGGWTVAYRAIPLGEEMELWESPLRDHVAADLVARYRQEVRERGFLKDFAATFADEGRTRYLGSAACAGCHPGIYEEWLNTKHAVALDTLADIDYHHDPECVRCHVVGFERMSDGRFTRTASGFVDPSRTAHLGGVGCENCHGPGSEHVAEPYDKSVWEPGPGKRNARKPTMSECQACHDLENSHGFLDEYARRYLPQVDHRSVPSDRRTVDRRAAPRAPKK